MRALKAAVQRLLYRFGYQIVAAPNWAVTRNIEERSGYRLADWRGVDGKFDLAGYRLEQEKGNRAKIQQIWTSEPNLKFIARWLKDRGMVPEFIICHGTRNGFEQAVFSSFFGCRVIGTEISSTANQFPMTVQADFHDPQPEWDCSANIVYSNSLDHAYDPAKALRAWTRSVCDKGVIVLEKASDSDPRGVSNLDPFGITLPNLMVFLLETLGEIACIRGLLDVPQPRPGASYHKMLVLEIDRRGCGLKQTEEVAP